MKFLFSWLLGSLLAGTAAQAQSPASATPAVATASLPASYLLGRSYRVETVQGSQFTGTLSSLSLTGLTFEVPELGAVSLAFGQVRQATLLPPAVPGRKPGYYDIGNGNSLLAAPTGRNLRKGEGSAQTVDLFLLGASYGITKNFSMGLYVSAFPGVKPGNQLLLLAPKLSTALASRLNLGVGLVYANVPISSSESSSLGLAYGALTYGTADDNLTLGLNYGFVSGEVSNTPVLQLGGQKRVSRRISLVSENYFGLRARTGVGGLYGIKINWPRTRLGLGAAYAYRYPYNDTYTYDGYTDPVTGNVYPATTQAYREPGRFVEYMPTYVVPVYIDFTFRFGKGSRQ